MRLSIRVYVLTVPGLYSGAWPPRLASIGIDSCTDVTVGVRWGRYSKIIAAGLAFCKTFYLFRYPSGDRPCGLSILWSPHTVMKLIHWINFPLSGPIFKCGVGARYPLAAYDLLALYNFSAWALSAWAVSSKACFTHGPAKRITWMPLGPRNSSVE